MRSLRAAPAFTAIVVVTIATGIGVTTALFSVVHGIAFPRVPYPAPERLAVLGGTIDRQIGVATELLTPEQLQLLRDRRPRSLTSTSAFGYQQAVIENRAGNTIRVHGAVVDGSFFRLLNVPPRAGRIIGPADREEEPVTVISDAFWRTHLDADPDVLHHTIRLGTTVYTVIGVMPQGFTFPGHAGYWIPQTTAASTQLPGAYLLVRLPDDVTYREAASEVAAWYDAAWYTDSVRFGGMGVALTRFGERERRIPADTLPLVVAGVAIIFLIALINLSVLFLARAARRGRELAIRTALGASPFVAVRPLAAELLVLTVAGACLGVAIAAAVLRLARVYVPEYTISATRWSDPRVLGFLIAVTLFVTVVLGLQPALRLRRFDVMASLGRLSAVATSTRRERRARNVVVAAQVTLALVLVTAAGIVAKSLVNLRTLDVGYDAERLVVAAPEYDVDKWNDARQRQLGESFLQRFTSRSDVASAATWRLRMAAWPPPLQDELFGVEHRERQIVPEAYALHRYYEVSPGFFRTLGIRVAGRDFRETDRPGSEPVAIVMESAARVWFGSEPALGRRVRIGPPGSEWLTVVGVVPDLQLLSGLGRVTATRGRAAYLAWLVRPLAQAGDTPPVNWPRRQCLDCAAITMAARLPDRGANAHEVARAMAVELRALAPELLVEPGRLLEQQMNWGTPALLRRNARVLLAFSALALGLALLGLHGIVADAVNRRTAEIGIRLALGARAPDVMRTIARESVSTAAAGVGLGVLIVATATTLTKKLFFAGGHRAALAGTSAADAYVLIPAAVAILLVACLTGLIGARRATKLDPSVALRAE